MESQPEPDVIRWRLHLASAPARVFALLASDAGRVRIWAEATIEREGRITWSFPNGLTGQTRVLASEPTSRFAVEYLGGSVATFELRDDGAGGTELTLTDAGIAEHDRCETAAGWVSVLLALKAAALIRDVFKRSKYQDVILPFMVLRRIDCVLVPTRERVLARYAELHGRLEDLDPQSRLAAGFAFHNTSPYTFE